MRGVRFTISRWMAATAVLCVNITLLRLYVVAEGRGEHLGPFNYGFFMFFTLQLGLWRYLTAVGRHRRFWLGFEVSGLAATLALAILLESDLDLWNWYTGAVSDLTYIGLPSRVDDMLTNEHPEWFWTIIFFLPELLAAVVGGLLAACSFRPIEARVGSTRPTPST